MLYIHPTLAVLIGVPMLIDCNTCKYLNEFCYKTKDRYNCLSEESPPQLTHYKYNNLMKRYIKFKFIHWEPIIQKENLTFTKQLKLLSDEDFEL